MRRRRRRRYFFFEKMHLKHTKANVKRQRQRKTRGEWMRLRPTDRMVAHTGYLTFGRPVTRTTRTTADATEAIDAEGEESLDLEEKGEE